MLSKIYALRFPKGMRLVFFKVGTDKDHVHFLIQSIPKYSVTEMIRTIKSITAKKIFEKHPEVKKQLWGEEFWPDGFFINTVSKFSSEDTISKYVRKQGMEKEYKKLHYQQINLL